MHILAVTPIHPSRGAVFKHTRQHPFFNSVWNLNFMLRSDLYVHSIPDSYILKEFGTIVTVHLHV